jgi:hypothetical protein
LKRSASVLDDSRCGRCGRRQFRPLDDGSTGLGIGAPADDRTDGAIPWATWRLVTPNYFTTIGVPILRGRTFDDGEENGWPGGKSRKRRCPSSSATASPD